MVKQKCKLRSQNEAFTSTKYSNLRILDFNNKKTTHEYTEIDLIHLLFIYMDTLSYSTKLLQWRKLDQKFSQIGNLFIIK